MGVLLTGTAGLCLWVILWAFGVSGFDAIIIPAFLVLVAIAVSMVTSGLFGRRE